MGAASGHEMQRFRNAVIERMGLQFEDTKLDFLAQVLQRRVDERGRGSAAAYLSELEREPSGAEISALARELTIGETYFFRNHEQFDALGDTLLMQRQCARGRERVLRLLSAGCSSGEEAYSMAIVGCEAISDPSWKVAIRAADINVLALEKARCARYSHWALRETSKEIRERWFSPDGRDVVLDASARSMVTFEEANLASDDSDLWQPAAYDVVFCRNVLMYFEPRQMRAVIARIARALVPGGFLFLGHAETLRGVSEDFVLCNSVGAFYYRLRGDDRRKTVYFDRRAPRMSVNPPAAQDAGWFDAICLASERVAALLPMPEAASLPAQSQEPSFDQGPILDLFRKEQFAEALKCLRAAAKSEEPNVLLLEAALLVHCGELRAGESAASRLLLIDAANAGAHYVLALCFEHDGFVARAAEHHRTAARLDPTFAMPRLHLALLARREGDAAGAGPEFTQALALLKSEEPRRLLLFGGGFSRSALVALCESALKDCGERRR
jgi:chemotaxis protein methyltransferase CheR